MVGVNFNRLDILKKNKNNFSISLSLKNIIEKNLTIYYIVTSINWHRIPKTTSGDNQDEMW